MSMREVLAYSLLSHETKPASAYSPILSSVFHFKRLMKNAFRWTSFAQYRLSARRRSLSILTCKRTQAVCRLTHKFAKTGRYASEEENGEDMCQIQAPISFREFKKIVWERAIRNSAS